MAESSFKLLVLAFWILEHCFVFILFLSPKLLVSDMVSQLCPCTTVCMHTTARDTHLLALSTTQLNARIPLTITEGTFWTDCYIKCDKNYLYQRVPVKLI